MEYREQYDKFRTLLYQFLKYNTTTSAAKGEIEQTASQLTAISKNINFMDSIAFPFILNEKYEKDKLVFITSLIKDRFKYDFQLLDKTKLLFYYSKLCEIGHFIGCQSFSSYKNISLALAYLYIHISISSEQNLQVFLQPFIPSQPTKFFLYNYYFKILEFLASQIDNSRMVIDEEHRELAKNRLIDQQNNILINLNVNAPKAWEIEQIDKQNIIQCFSQWTIMNFKPQILNSLPNHYVMNRLFDFISDDRRTDETSISLRNIVNHLKNPKEIPALYEFMSNKIIDLLSLVDKFGSLADINDAQDYLNIIIDFCLKVVDVFIVRFDDKIYEFLRRLVVYTHDEIVDVYENMIQYWEQFVLGAGVEKQNMTLNPKIYDLISEVYDAVCLKCKYPLKFIKQLNIRDESRLNDVSRLGQQIFKRRQESEDLFQKISELYGKQQYIKLVYSKIQIVANQSEQVLWPSLDIYLYSLIDALRKIEKNYPEIGYIIGIYLQLNSKQTIILPTIVKKSFLRIFRSLMSIQEKDANFIQNIFYLTSTCFEQPLLISTAEKAFERGCQYNHALMKDKIDQMISLLQNYPNRVHIVKGIIYIVCQYEDLTVKYLQSIMTYLFQLLVKADKEYSKKKQLMNSFIGIIKSISQLPQNMQTKSILVVMTRNMWSYLKQSLVTPNHLKDDEDTQIERVVKYIKMLMRYLKFEFAEFIEDLYSSMLQAFRTYPICAYPYLVEIAITVYYSDERFTDYFSKVYIEFCMIIFEHMRNMAKMDKYIYLLDDFIGMNKRFFVLNASIVLNSGLLAQIIDLCITAFVGNESPRIAKASYAFFEHMFMVYWRQEFIEQYNASNDEEKDKDQDKQKEKFQLKASDQPLYFALRTYLTDKLEHILFKVVQHWKKVPNELTREYIINVLIAEIQAFPQQNKVIWRKLMDSLDADILVANEKIRFIANIDNLDNIDFEVVRTSVKILRRYIFLINGRMIVAEKRKSAY